MGNLAIRLQWCKNGFFEPLFAMDEDALVFFHVAQFVSLDFVLFLLVVIARHHAVKGS